MPVAAIPLTTSGKKQRYRLRQEYLDGLHDPVWGELAARLDAHEHPGLVDRAWRDDIERHVAALCRPMLPQADIGRTEDLYSLGLDSLGATRLLFDLEAASDIVLPIDTLRVYSTVATIARRASDLIAGQREGHTGSRGGSPYQPDHFARDLAPLCVRAYAAFAAQHIDLPAVERFAVGPLQRRHISRSLTHPQVFHIDVQAGGDEDELRAAVTAVIEQQQLLRATIHEREDGHEFCIHEFDGCLEIPVIDVSGYTVEGHEHAIRDISTALPAEFEADSFIARPLYHITIVKRADTAFTALFLINHLISDHESGRILERALYEHLCGAPSSQDRLSYRHFLEHSRNPALRVWPSSRIPALPSCACRGRGLRPSPPAAPEAPGIIAAGCRHLRWPIVS